MLRKYTYVLLTSLIYLLSHSAFANLSYRPIKWPEDDRAHFDNHKVVTEWWFFTGKLTTKTKKIFSYYATIQCLTDKTKTPILYFQLTDLNTKKIYGNTINLPHATISNKILDVTADYFTLTGYDNKYHLAFTLPTDHNKITLDLELISKKLPLLVGPNAVQRGLVTMGNNTNSYYYSLTHMQTSGYIQIDNRKFKIDEDDHLSRSWMDHQWGDFSVDTVIKNNPWIWIAMQLADGTDFNVGEFVLPKTSQPLWPSLANISYPDGSASYKPAKIILGPHKKGSYPLTYILKVGNKEYRLETPVSEQNKNGVWMGIMSVNGQSLMESNASFAIVENTVPQ